MGTGFLVSNAQTDYPDYPPRHQEHCDQQVDLVALEQPRPVPVQDAVILAAIVHRKMDLSIVCHDSPAITIKFTLTTAVGVASRAASSHTRTVTFLAWEVVHRYCAFIG